MNFISLASLISFMNHAELFGSGFPEGGQFINRKCLHDRVERGPHTGFIRDPAFCQVLEARLLTIRRCCHENQPIFLNFDRQPGDRYDCALGSASPGRKE